MEAEKLQALHEFMKALQLKRKIFEMSDMILRHAPGNAKYNSPHLAYCRTGTLTHNTHAGQMKLLLADEMSIMLGLLHICKESKRELKELTHREIKVAVVVAGAAPGNHFSDLAKTFAFVDFHLYDPAPWGWYEPLEDRERTTNVSLYKEKFTGNMATEWSGKKGYDHIIFLSDLRTTDGLDGDTVFSQERFENSVSDDMENQKKMTIALGACYSVLKFRLRYYYDGISPDKEILEYFDGTIYLEGYPPNHSTETRLHVTDPSSVKKYEIKVYQDQLFYHNQVTRNPGKVLFGEGSLSYDNAYSRFVEDFLREHLSFDGESVRDRGVFDHYRVRALLDVLGGIGNSI